MALAAMVVFFSIRRKIVCSPLDKGKWRRYAEIHQMNMRQPTGTAPAVGAGKKRRDMQILVLENSTTSAKAMWVSGETGAVEVRTAPYPPGTVQEGTCQAEQSFQAAVRLGRQLAAGRRADAVALTTTWHSLLLCGPGGEALSPVYLWSYPEAAGYGANMQKDQMFSERFYQITGCGVHGSYPFFKYQVLREQGRLPGSFRISDQGSYNLERLTGHWASNRCMASGSGWLDLRRGEWSQPLRELCGLSLEQFPPLVSCRQTFPLSPEGAAMLGLEPGTPVLTALPDGGMNQVGSGACREGELTVSVGTTGALRMTVPAPRLGTWPGLWCYRIPEAWLCGAAVSGACNCLDWFREQLAGGAGYGALEAPADWQADTPVFLPFLWGERCPGWQAERRGGFWGLQGHHTRRQLYRAVQEGVLFSLRHCLDQMEEQAGEPRRIFLSGGILQSPGWTQMCADILGRELELDAVAQASMTGAAVTARWALGKLHSLEEYRPAAGGTVAPNPAMEAYYREKYKRYRDAYQRTGVR